MPDDATGAGGPPKGPSELTLRVISGSAMVVVALAALWFGGWPFALLWIAAGAAAGWEWSRITEPDQPEMRHYAFGLAVAAAGLLVATGWLVPALIWITALVLAGSLSGHHRRLRMSGVLYASAIAIAPVIVRAEPGIGMALIAWCFAVVWATDIAAYFTGRALGGPKLWPSVSPKKTWSGAIGGAAAGIAAGLAVALGARALGVVWPMGLFGTAVAALVCSAAGQFGDLAESALKRHHGVKDSSHIIPGHGGVLDRLDAFVVVVSLVALTALITGA
jgi:phosphatidate cytidylyltransferase